MRPLALITASVIAMALPAHSKETTMNLTPDWEYVADGVMGGVSTGKVTQEDNAARLTGTVSLDNNGGFIQMAFDLVEGGGPFDASEWTGIEVEVQGNDETYEMRLRTDQLTRPWHSFRAEITAASKPTTLRLPFTSFEPHRTDVTFDPARLRRIGILAIGRVFEADVSVLAIRLYR